MTDARDDADAALFNATTQVLHAGALAAAGEAGHAAETLEEVAQRISKALELGDALAAFIVERALSSREGENILIGFDSLDAASIANMALKYQEARKDG